MKRRHAPLITDSGGLMIGFKELAIIALIVIVIFGTGKLRNLGGDIGGAIKSFKKAVKEGDDSDKPEEGKDGTDSRS